MIKDLTEDNLPKNLLEGKTIVISGAGSGIGRQASKTFSDYGANLILPVSYTHLTLPTKA